MFFSGNKINCTTIAKIIPYSKVQNKFSNIQEAEIVLNDYKMLHEKYPELKIGIIVFYHEQRYCIMQKALKLQMDIENIDILTIDTAQGKEYDITLLSVGRTDGEFGFLKNKQDILAQKPHNGRILTAITRHRLFSCVYINKVYTEKLKQNNTEYLNILIDFYIRNGLITKTK